MRALALAGLALLLAAPALAQAERVEERAYAGPTHATSARFLSCSTQEPVAVNGLCFRLGGESHATVTLHDASGLPVRMRVLVERPGESATQIESCAASVEVPLAAGASVLRVWLPPADDQDLCPIPYSPPTTGVALVAFS